MNVLISILIDDIKYCLFLYYFIPSIFYYAANII